FKVINLFKRTQIKKPFLRPVTKLFTENENKEEPKENTVQPNTQAEQMRGLETFNYLDMKRLITQAEANIDSGVFFIKQIPDNNYFGEIPLYICPAYIFNSLKTMEISGLPLTLGLTYLSYLDIILSKTYLFPFYSFVSFLAISKVFNKRK